MNKNKTSSKFWDNKIVWAVLAILGSVLMWLYVTMTVGEQITRSYSGVVVEYTNRDVLRDEQELIITNVSAATVTVRLTGTRRELDNIKSDSMIAVVDVSKTPYAGPHTQPLEVTFAQGTGTSTITNKATVPDTVDYILAKEVTKTVEVRGDFNGKIAEGYNMIDKPSFAPGTVVIRGPEEEVNLVDYAWVDITWDEVDSTLDYDSTYTLRDKDGNKLDMGNIELDQEFVRVTVQVLATKEVPLTVSIVEGAGATADNTEIKCEPATITISGEKEDLDAIDKITIGTIDLTSFEATYEQMHTVVMPDGINNVTGIQEAKVTIQIFGLEIRTFTVDNITVTNVTQGYTAEILTESKEVKLRGPADLLAQVEAHNIRLVADATDIGSATGEFEPGARVMIDGVTGVGAVGEYKVYIRIRSS